jgi:hypothetical protein
MKREIVHREEVLEAGVWEKIIGGGKDHLQDGLSEIDMRAIRNRIGSLLIRVSERARNHTLHGIRPVLVNKRSEGVTLFRILRYGSLIRDV